VANRVDEVLTLSMSQGGFAAGASADLDWFTQLQSPMLVTMIGIIVAHELGHYLVAATSKVSIHTYILMLQLVWCLQFVSV
jgi:hypothetical protein